MLFEDAFGVLFEDAFGVLFEDAFGDGEVTDVRIATTTAITGRP